MLPSSKMLLSCLMLLPYIKAEQAEKVKQYDLCEGAEPNVEKNDTISDVGLFLTGVHATWDSPPVDVVSDIKTPAACMDLVYHNNTAHYKDLSFEYDQDTEVCSIWYSTVHLGIDYNATAKSSVYIGSTLGHCSANMKDLDRVKTYLIWTAPDKVEEGKAALDRVTCCDVWYIGKKQGWVPNPKGSV